jgi:hypothetical protein
VRVDVAVRGHRSLALQLEAAQAHTANKKRTMLEQMDFAPPMIRPIQPFDEVCAGLKFFGLSHCVTIPSRALPT